MDLFYFLSLGLKSAPISNASTKRSIVDFWQCSEYVSGSKYAMVLKIPFPKYKKVLFPESHKRFFQKIEETFLDQAFLGKNIRNFLGKNFKAEAEKCAR